MNIRKAVWRFVHGNPRCHARFIANSLGLSITQVRDAINGLLTNKLVKKVKGTGHVSRPYLYSTTDVEPTFGKGNHKGKKSRKRFNKTNRQKLWNNMKISRKFTVSELLSTISIGESTARNYVTYLLKSGYVVERSRLPKHKRNSAMNGKEIVWLLVRDSGRLAPIVRANGVWDQNEQRFYPFKTLGKEQETRDDVA